MPHPTYYAMPDDASSEIRVPFRITAEDAPRYNSMGNGIFWVVNEFTGARKKENLIKIHAWFVDMDEYGKDGMRLAIQKSPLQPSWIIETKNGYHLYWLVDGIATVSNWDAIVKMKLIPFFVADRKACDPLRLLRVPGFLHQKDPANPFEIKIIRRETTRFREELMLEAFPKYYPFESPIPDYPVTRINPTADPTTWEKLYDMDQSQSLLKLSGHPIVAGEVFSFTPNHNGTFQIKCGGKRTSCWIDKNRRIGSTDKGGPTIWEWCAWYGASDKEIYAVVREIFPELF